MSVKIRFWMAAAGLALLWAVRASAMDGNAGAKAYQGSAEFQRIKDLTGVWKGTTNGKDPQEVTVEFQPTAGGSAVVQRLFPGTPHEMLDVYYEQGKRLRMTHYCATGNRPNMALKKSDEKEMRFVLDNDPVIDPGRDAHMHSVKFTFTDKDHITEDWVMFKRGKQTDVTSISLTRVSNGSSSAPELPVPGPGVPAEIPSKK
jgi:hypothetical protein